MTGKQLILDVLAGKEVERCPWVPYTGSQIANLKGYTAEEIFKDGDKLLECLLEAASQYTPDGMPPIFDLQVEAEILGCDLTWYKNTPPTVCSHPLDGLTLEIPTQRLQKTDGRIPLILDVMKRFKAAQPDIAMYGLVCGPFTLASHLRGTNIFMDMYDNEEGVKALVDYCADVVADLAKYYIEAGCDIIAAVDPLVSQISPDMFNTFLKEPYTKLFDAIKAENVPSCFFVCGDATKNIEPMCETGTQCIAIDENVDILAAKEVTDKYDVTISGNLQLTVTMLLGTQQDNQKEAIELMDKMGTKRFILAPGCDVPFDAPAANLIGVGQAVHNKEAVRKALENYVAQDNLPEIEMPDYASLDYVLVEVVTIDSKTCAACGYMTKAANDAAATMGDRVKVVERSMMYPENLAFMNKIGLKNAPSIVINGEIKHISLIPTVEDLREEIAAAEQK
ncbi:uroporphyrinogen decarboxylase family protein [Desulfobaculum bizertense]|uniref:Uroporphyrinogen decarboxylase n=1 Tax=Desulfobaculum bizertense DSM 18034 TaxID=1121442 RepID=A0A1T4VPT6_9BACT|nr:uroporphyrinogen decarboxylase family protein [Desulfobaculum bizertense]UIJ38219.1 uroporphyrinogen decarboxylase [Desulfobaculum bizertense]SKA66858.1 uroporphyrinogen decarboxylase [Desulfobaculum bizertense DSM 18034]